MAFPNPEPCVAVALQPSLRGTMHRRDIKQNIDSIAVVLNAAVWLSAEFPVRLVALRAWWRRSTRSRSWRRSKPEVAEMRRGAIIPSIEDEHPRTVGVR